MEKRLQRDSNTRSTAYEAVALPLGHTPNMETLQENLNRVLELSLKEVLKYN